MSKGFTLIELLVSMVLFAVLTMLAYGGYNTSSKQALIARESMQRVQAIQTTIRLLAQDFEQLAPRPVRDVLGDGKLPAIIADNAKGTTLVTLTRSGWSNPAGVQRSTLQRVSYVLENGVLRRDHQIALDATLNSEIVKRELLKDVKEVRLKFMLARDKQWYPQWPPPSQPANEQSRPIGVEVILDLKDYGEIRRLIEVGG